jgi:uncharacterized repeat protein (TIGR01451 family)
MTGRNCFNLVSIPRLAFTAVLLLLLCRPPMAAAVEFSNVISYPVGISPVAMAAGDFNGDGKPDLAVANQGDWTTANPGSVSILLGKGDGTFQPAVDYPAGQTPNSIAVGDFNGDGKLDLAVANQGLVTIGIDGSVSILLGKGDGTFQAAVDYSAGEEPNSIAVGDLNGDGKLDLAVANMFDSRTATWINGSVSILLGIGDGTFQPPVDYQPCPSPYSVGLGDLNLDGNLDVIALGGSTGSPLGVLLGNGDGTFQSPLPFSAGGSVPFVLGDFNRDGNLDLAYSMSGYVDVFLGNGDGTFQPGATVLAFGGGFRSVHYSSLGVAADFNGDGKLDLTGWHRACDIFLHCSASGPGSMFMLMGRGDGTFLKADGPFPSSLIPKISADFNGDNLPDVAAVGESSGRVSILLNTSPTSGADLALAISSSLSPVAVGHNQTFTISVLNTGPQDATGVTVTDTLPAELTLVSATPSQGSCQGTSSISCDLGSLASPRSAEVTIEVTVKAAGTNNTITNQASVSAAEPDLKPGNNSATAATNVQNFQISVTTSSLTVTAGGSVTDTVSLAPVDGFNQAASLACTGAPRDATCEISPSSLTLDGSNPADATLTIKTTARSSSLPFAGKKPFGTGRHLPISWAVLLMLLMLFAHNTRDLSRRRAAQGLMFAATALLVVMWVACGGGNNTTGSGGPPPEVSALTVTATSGNFTQSTTVTLTIK